MNDLKPGQAIELDGNPYEVLSASHQKKARGNATVSAKLRDIRTHKTRGVTFHPSDNIKEAHIEKKEVSFHHRTRDEFVFLLDNDETAHLPAEYVEKEERYLKQNLPVTLVYIKNTPEKVELPIKAEYEVKDAPPNVRGDTAQGGTKEVTIETGARIKTPLFIEQGDIIEVNTETDEYVRRTNT